MRTVYELGAARYWTGRTMELDVFAPSIPSGWTERTPPELQDGQWARLTAEGWSVTDVPPPEAVPAPPAPEPEDTRPELRIVTILPDAAHMDATVVDMISGEVTCPAGTTLTVSVDLRLRETVIPLDGTFRLPLRSRDGREKVLLAALHAGVGEIVAPMRDSGVWEVSEAAINEKLPDEQKMRFRGIGVFVVEV